MLSITAVTLDGCPTGLVTDEPPRVSFALTSERAGELLDRAEVRVGPWSVSTSSQVAVPIDAPLEPWTDYTVEVSALGRSGDRAEASAHFRTGRLGEPWLGSWITHPTYRTPRRGSPVPLVFRHDFVLRPGWKRAWIASTALGIYELELNERKVGTDYFAPGFTSYAHHIQYQTYDISEQLDSSGAQRVIATVGGGWAVGDFTSQRRNRTYADVQAFLAEIHVEYDDGVDVIGTSPDWLVSRDGPYREAEWYDGEVVDARVTIDAMTWQPARRTRPRGTPQLTAAYGTPVRPQQEISPVAVTRAPSGEVIYDFGQNFAGVVRAQIHGNAGQEIVFRHAEVLVDGELFTKSLRTAKARAQYTCIDGAQEYSPRLTYMGFRYVGVRGVEPDHLNLSAIVLHSEMKRTGEFVCSNDELNALQSAIEWGARSNLVEIPTDCPQRDEREGWTGDFALFGPTAAFLFDTSRFTRKWLRDVQSEQGRGGGIPVVVPRAGSIFPVFATSVWGDVCVLAPWAEYMARGDDAILRENYPTMRRFVKAALWWSRLLSTGRRRYIWRWPFHFGDWAAPTGAVPEWTRVGRWIATPYLANSLGILVQIAEILGHVDDARHFAGEREKVVAAYRAELTDGAGRVSREFQTGYVLPLRFGMTTADESAVMSQRLSDLVKEAGGHLATGFPGTPHILFALSDTGRLDEAYELLSRRDPPSWLYMIAAGGTTIWERWDALQPDGRVNLDPLIGRAGADASRSNMVSFNHYAAGAVGEWFVTRIAGLEPLSAGYREFRVAPHPGGGLTFAAASLESPYGHIGTRWDLRGNDLTVEVQVPVSCRATVQLPDGSVRDLESGRHLLACHMPITS